MEIANRKGIFPGSAGLAQTHPLAKPPAMRKQTAAGVGFVQLRSTLPIRAFVLDGRFCFRSAAVAAGAGKNLFPSLHHPYYSCFFTKNVPGTRLCRTLFTYTRYLTIILFFLPPRLARPHRREGSFRDNAVDVPPPGASKNARPRSTTVPVPLLRLQPNGHGPPRKRLCQGRQWAGAGQGGQCKVCAECG